MKTIRFKGVEYPITSSAAIRSLFDRTGTKLKATNVQDALSEIDSNMNNMIINTQATVPVDSWTEDTTYTDFPFKANISVQDVNENYYPDVTFDLNDALSGMFAPISESSEGIVSIFASAIPETEITVSINCAKGV